MILVNLLQKKQIPSFANFLDPRKILGTREVYCRVCYDGLSWASRSVELSMNAVALFTLSCTIMTATAPTMKVAAIPVSIRQVEAAYPHLNPPGH